MSEKLAVDTDALNRVADRLSSARQCFGGPERVTIGLSDEELGSVEVASAYDEFQSRWQRRRVVLCDGIDNTSQAVRGVAERFATTDAEIATRAQSIR